MNFALLRGDKPGGHHHRLSAQGQRRSEGAAIGNASHGNNRNLHCFGNPRREHHGGHIVIERMTSFLNARGINAVVSSLLRMHRMAHRSHLVEESDPCFFQNVDEFFSDRLVQRGTGYFKAGNFFFSTDFQIHFVMLGRNMHRWQNGHIHHKGFIRQLFCQSYRVTEFALGRVISGRQVSQTAGVGYRRTKFRFA